MSRRTAVLEEIGRTRVVSIVRGADARLMEPLAEALSAGGVSCIEVTMNTPGALEMIAAAKRRPGLMVGAGTVLTLEQARQVADLGADFILAPNLSLPLIRFCLDRDILPVPGAFTPTEIYAAAEAGAELIKLFPAGPVGPSYIKDILGPFNTLKLLPVGGVNLENTAAFMAAGAFAVGVGSSLANPRHIAEGKFQELESLARDFVVRAALNGPSRTAQLQ